MVRLPLAPVMLPKVVAVRLRLPWLKNGWFRKLFASAQKPSVMRSLILNVLLSERLNPNEVFPGYHCRAPIWPAVMSRAKYAGLTEPLACLRSDTFVWKHRQEESYPEVIVAVRCRRDRKSTRLNSSHLGISYAVFCLKK